MKSTKIYENKSGHYTTAVKEANGVDTTGHVYRFVSGLDSQALSFQFGPVKEVGVNGCENEQIIEAPKK